MTRTVLTLALVVPTAASAFTLPRPIHDWQATEAYCLHDDAAGGCTPTGVSNDTQSGSFDLGPLGAGNTLDTVDIAPSVPIGYLYGSDHASLSHGGDIEKASANDLVYYFEHSFDATLGFEVDEDWYSFTPEADLCFDVCFKPGHNTTSVSAPTDWTLDVYDSTITSLDTLTGPFSSGCVTDFVGDGSSFHLQISDPTPQHVYPTMGYGFTIDASAAAYQATWYADDDNDGQGDANDAGTVLCGDPGRGFVQNNDDCDDLDDTVYLGATELCNGEDDDCDGTADNGLPFAPYWPDADGDGYGDETAAATDFCDDPGTGWSSLPEDCNDADDTVHPVHFDDCDGVDTDCDGTIDEDATLTTYYVDADGDGFGDIDDPGSELCSDPGNGYSTSNDDCDDTDADVNPSGTEVPYDGIDQDCSGDDACDEDGDNRRATECGGGDCDDTDASINQAADEIWYDGVDQDCDGNDCDQDGDGLDAAECDGLDCDDTDPSVGECVEEGPEPWVQGGMLCSQGGAPGALWMLGLVPLLVRRRS